METQVKKHTVEPSSVKTKKYPNLVNGWILTREE